MGHFQSVKGLQLNLELPKKWMELGQNGFQRTLPGTLSWPNLVLTRAITTVAQGDNNVVNNKLFEWAVKSAGPGLQMADNKFKKKKGSITLLGRDNKKLAAWAFEGAVLVSWKGPAFDVGSDDVLTEEVEIAHEGFYPA